MGSAASPEYLDSRPTIEVDDLAAALSFWTDVCGFAVEVSMDEPPFAIVSGGQASIGIAEGAAPVQQPPIAVVYFTLNGIDGLLERFETAGVELEVPLTQRPWGLRDVVV